MKKFGEPLLYAILFYILTQSVDGKRGRQVLILAIAHFFSFIRFLFKQSEGKKIIRHVKKMSKFCRYAIHILTSYFRIKIKPMIILSGLIIGAITISRKNNNTQNCLEQMQMKLI